MKAGIMIDDWKLPVFSRRLTDAGYTFTNAGAATAGTLLLTVETNDLVMLAEVVKASQTECARAGKPRG